MNFARTITLTAVLLFTLILGAGGWKQYKKKGEAIQSQTIDLDPTAFVFKAAEPSPELAPVSLQEGDSKKKEKGSQKELSCLQSQSDSRDGVDRLELLFNPYGPHLGFVQRVRYSPNVSWLKDRPAWIVDYAAHYQTTKHFISRSLSQEKNYLQQEIRPGDYFNVLRTDIPLGFYLLVDLGRCKLRLFTYDSLKKESVLLKTYDVQVGRRDERSPSGSLTPLGVYRLGSRIAVYKPGVFDVFRKQKREMIEIFGTRWIPFEEEIQGCSAPAKKYGIHGFAWVKTEEGWKEVESSPSGYDSDGCIRLRREDIEELFSIIVMRPSFIEIAKQFDQAVFEIHEIEPKIVNSP